MAWEETALEEVRTDEPLLEMTFESETIELDWFEDILDEDVVELPFSQGLSPERIKKFEHFTADESLVGEQCLICMNDLEIGMEMVRLDCHVDHILCKVCVEKWFENHKTCPTCRHEFN